MSEPNGRSADDWFHDYCEANQRARQAEARAEKAEAKAEDLEEDISSFNTHDSVMALNEIGVALGLSPDTTDYFDDESVSAVKALVEKEQKAEAENARLTKMVDWLAKALAEDGCPYLAYWADFEGDMRPDWCICTDTPDDGFDCTGNPKECWQKEAASRAVAAGEG